MNPTTTRCARGWYFFDWATQPYYTLLITFVFAPYISELLGDGTSAQSIWGYCIGGTYLLIAALAPVLGASADMNGTRMQWLWVFSIMQVVGATGIWWAAPDNFNLFPILGCFALGIVGLELATSFTNAMLPNLGDSSRIGRISGNGMAFGYAGGLLALAIMLTLFADNATTGKTIVGIDPILGLDAGQREGTRAVGPFTAVWYVVFMIPFFLWIRDRQLPRRAGATWGAALSGLSRHLYTLPRNRSLLSYLGSSMFYRDGLGGIYVFGGIYASGVLGWSIAEIGIFGILTIVTSAVFAWIGGFADRRFGPKPVIRLCVWVLIAVTLSIMSVNPSGVFGISVPKASILPDVTFYILGATIGAAGGVLQSASRTMMVRQANPVNMTEAFGLYAMAGKATSFLAPLLVGATTEITGSQQLGIAPVVLLFAVGLVLLKWVEPDYPNGKEHVA